MAEKKNKGEEITMELSEEERQELLRFREMKRREKKRDLQKVKSMTTAALVMSIIALVFSLAALSQAAMEEAEREMRMENWEELELNFGQGRGQGQGQGPVMMHWGY